ncbi:MAG: RNase H family protein [Flavobacterium sp.]
MKYKIDLYTRVKIDTSSDAKAYANMLCIGDQCKSFGEGYIENSQSRISLMAIVKGLEQIKEGAEVTIYTTSKYVMNTYEKGWVTKWMYNDWLKGDGEPPLNIDLWRRFAIQMKRHQLAFHHVTNYKKYPQLVECREIGAGILLQPQLHIDEVYRSYLEELQYNLHNLIDEQRVAEIEVVLDTIIEPVEEVEDKPIYGALETANQELDTVAKPEETVIYESTYEALDDIDEEVEEHEEEHEESQSHSRPVTFTRMPSDIKLLVTIRDQLNSYFADQPTKVELRSTDLYDEIRKNKALKERFPHPVLFNRFLRKQHQEGILKQIIPNCKIDTYNTDFYQWYFHK